MSPEFEVDTTRQPVGYGQQSQIMNPGQDLWHYLRAYAREKPDVCALWCFGVGFVLGWKLKPW
jgi:hypothetical protein